MAERDSYFDAFKGMMILSVINIHTVYWSLKPYTPDIVRELAYFIDIPIFFFISGYFAKHSEFLKTTRQVLRQLIRLYLKYLAITAVVAAGVLLWVFLFKDRVVEGLGPSLLSIFTLQLSGELWGYFKGYYGNLWYLHTYFPLLLLVPIMIGLPLFARLRFVILFFILVLYFLFTYEHRGHIFLLREWGDILFYSFVFMLGVVYRMEEKSVAPRHVLFSLVLTCLVAFLIFQLDGELRLSRYKFPPTFQWLVYSLLLVHVFILARPHWQNRIRPRIGPLAPGLEWLGENVFTVYLIQGLVCSIPFLFVAGLSQAISSTVLLYLIVYSFNVGLTVVLALLYSAGAARVKNLTDKLIHRRAANP